MTDRNPWLDIPAADYLGHMGSPEVGQLAVLSNLFREALDRFRPADVLLLGCSTGNGLRHIDASITRHVTAIDFNPEYLAILQTTLPSPRFNLELRCEDIAEATFEPDAVDMVHCALLFEYLDWSSLIPRLSRATRENGVVSVVLQCPDKSPAVTKTNYPSLRRLERVFQFVEPPALALRAREYALEMESQRIESLKSGRLFAVLYFRKSRGMSAS